MQDHAAMHRSSQSASTGEDDRIRVEAPCELSTDAYERMCTALYAYRFGQIGFLDLLTKFEEILDIEPPQSDTKPTLEWSDTEN